MEKNNIGGKTITPDQQYTIHQYKKKQNSVESVEMLKPNLYLNSEHQIFATIYR